jgi:hypothetical protein
MIWQRKFGMALAIVIALGSASLDATAEPAAGAMPVGRSAPAESQSPSDLAREGMAKMLEAFNRFVDSVPQYEMPQLNENGDIILRRKRPETAPVAPPAKTPDPAADRAI